MKVIKRNGNTTEFNKEKIDNAILKAMKYGSGIVKANIAYTIANDIEKELIAAGKEEVNITEIETMVFEMLIAKKQKITARAYESYRAVQEFKRNKTELDRKIEGIVDGSDKDIINENSNKNSTIASTQRDLIAGEYSKDYSRRVLLPSNILHAHDEGIIHMHDLDYFVTHIHNCTLINLEDMLQNGTIINRKFIDKPKSLQTACTVATQIVQQVANGQYGGQTISLTHLAPFVRISYEKLVQKYLNRGFKPISARSFASEDLKEEVKAGMQTIQYQINTFNTSNGQAPFLSVYMHISEDPEYEKETAMLIEEVLNQRIIGMKNEAGVYITPAFPKLLYVTDENNIHSDSEYYYLTKLAAECVSKRMMPDFISAKKMREEHDGEVFPCMGCVEENEIITYKYYSKLYVESFIRMWNRLALDFKIEHQFSEENPSDNPNMFMNLSGVTIYDSGKNDFVITEKIIKNVNKNNWIKIELSGGRLITCTEDHPFPTARGRVLAGDLKIDDIITINKGQYVEEGLIDSWDSDLAWAYGVLLHKANLSETVTIALPRASMMSTSLINIINHHYDTYCDVKEIDDCRTITFTSEKLQQDLTTLFGGIKKSERHIPNEIFSMNRETRMEMLAGIADANGRICTDDNQNKAVIKTANKEIALQIMALMQSLDMPASIKEKEMPDFKTPKYKVSCTPSKELLESMLCLNLKGSLTDFAFNNSPSSGNKPKTIKDGRVISTKNIYVNGYSYDVTTESDYFDVSGIYSHNCRSFLGLFKDENGKYKWYGRFNQGTVALNLVDVGLSAEHDIDMFWSILEERLGLCFQALMLRHERLKNTSPDISPIHWRHGAIARSKDDNYNELLYNGYSSISLGYAGLYECIMALIGESHTGEKGKKLALEIMQYLKKTCEKWKKETNIGFALYGTPLESTTDKLAKCLKKRFGIVPGVTDHDYVTNSYHVNVTENISAEDKLKFESEFQAISSGGFISYIESCNLSNNVPAVINLIQYMYENIKYAEINGKFDYCQKCDFSGEILLDEHNEWYCPNCNNKDHSTMNVARRTCGYIGDNFWNDGRTAEIGERFVHVDNKELVI